MIAEYKLIKGKFEKPELEIVRKINKKATFETTNDVVNFLNSVYKLNRCIEEYVYIIAVDSSMSPIGVFCLAHGGDSEANVSVRQLFINLLAVGANGFFMIHNHPSRISEFSQDDIDVTRKINYNANFLGVEFLDHIVISGNEFISMKSDNLF